MKRVDTQFGEDIYLNKYTEYTESDFDALFSDLKGKLLSAKESGLTNVYVQFCSTLEAYENNMPGPVEVQIRGYREQNNLEKAQQREQERIQDLAIKLGITFYEASVVDRLEKQKKVKL